MINREILANAARTGQTSELNVAREYCQHLFLSSFYQQKGSERVMFKGGTALKIVYGSPRFSEDLDFSGFGVNVAQIECWVLTSAGEIELNAVEVDIQESKTTSGGYLANLDCRFYDYPVRLQIEISLLQQSDAQGQGVLVTPDYLPAYTLTLLPASRLVEEKITAALTRGKPRDFFDLYFLLRKGLITPEVMPRLKPVKDTLSNLTIDFHGELAQFLPRSHQAVLRDFRKVLLDEFNRHGVLEF